MNSLWLALSKRGLLLPHLHIPGHGSGWGEGALGGSWSPIWLRGWVWFPRPLGQSLPWSGARFPHLENEGLQALSPALPPARLYLGPGEPGSPHFFPSRWPGRDRVPASWMWRQTQVVCLVYLIGPSGLGPRPCDFRCLESLDPGPGCAV